MKSYSRLLLPALLLATLACSRTQKTEKTINSQLRTHKEAIDTLRESAAAAAMDENGDAEEQPREVLPLQLNPLSEDESRELFTVYSLSALFVAQENEEENDYSSAIVNGFYGQDHYRIEAHFSSMIQDAEHPNIYYLEGKTRYKKNITPFKGKITFETVQTIKDPNLNEEDLKSMDAYTLYTTTGRFELQEDSAFHGSGVFAGQLHATFMQKADKGLRLWYYSQTDPASGAGFVFDGNWTSYKTGNTKPVLWAQDLFMIANTILEEFSIGERDVQINPKYRKLGWDNFWENEEWWNESPKAL